MEFIRDNRTIIIIVYLSAWAVMSLITLLLYKIDKTKAQKRKWRIKESVLLTFPWILGSIGSMLGLYVLRHKNRHWYFVINNFLSLILHIIILIFIIVI